MSLMPGRASEDVYSPIRCAGEVAHGKSFSAEKVCRRIMDIVHDRVMMSMHRLRRWTLYRAESPGAGVSPIRNPTRAFFTSTDGVEIVSETYSMPLPRVPLWTRKGAVSGWVPKYASGS